MLRGRSSRLQSRYDQVGPWRMHARVGAVAPRCRRPPVVLVHGLGVSSRYMIPAAQQLAPDFPVYAPDLPGFGRSSRPRHTLSVEEMADALAAWIRAANIGPAVLVGNSMGCQAAVECAVQHPRLVLGLVLLGPTMDPAAPTALRQIGRLLREHWREPLSLNLIVARDYLGAGPLRVWRTFRHGLRHRIEQRLPLVEAPVLVVRGNHDSIVPQRWARQAAALAPRGSMAVINHKSHAVNYSAAAQVAALVRKFVSDHRLAARSALDPGRCSG